MNELLETVPLVPAAIWFALVGTLIGSYLNVVIYRLPRGLSTIKPRSSCPGCGNLIGWYDNIPLLSYLALRGRCRHCHTSIHWRYPLVEATTGALFVASFLVHGLTWSALAAAVYSAILLALALIDLEHFLLPNKLTYPGLALGLLGSLVVTWTNPVSSLIGAVVGASMLLLLIGVWYLVRKEQGMGYGDVKMLAMLGAFLGLHGMAVSLFIAALSGSILGLGLIALTSGDLRTRLPFGVFLSFGGLVALFSGQHLLSYYMRLF